MYVHLREPAITTVGRTFSNYGGSKSKNIH